MLTLLVIAPSAMIHQDVLMRQIRQFTKAIATLLGQSHREQPDETLRMIDQACKDHLDGSAEALRTLPPSTLLELCHEGNRFVPEAAESLAQTLQEMGEAHRERDEPEKAGACFARSLILYRRMLEDPDAPVSWQIGTTVAALSERVDSFPVDDAAQDALDALRNAD
ncbi:hypothetical protein [Salinibacter sp. 10B]|uniref:hypothetical protein n=1 Tax=Salinibacter sp. 10B TaxID=1923971 RepID=UPI00215739CD|nr:hypothetical protein [Salinibacter sp. 10B]